MNFKKNLEHLLFCHGKCQVNCTLCHQFLQKKICTWHRISWKVYPDVHILQTHSLQFCVPYLPSYSPIHD
jgi:hypothetical protein